MHEGRVLGIAQNGRGRCGAGLKAETWMCMLALGIIGTNLAMMPRGPYPRRALVGSRPLLQELVLTGSCLFQSLFINPLSVYAQEQSRASSKASSPGEEEEHTVVQLECDALRSIPTYTQITKTHTHTDIYIYIYGHALRGPPPPPVPPQRSMVWI